MGYPLSTEQVGVLDEHFRDEDTIQVSFAKFWPDYFSILRKNNDQKPTTGTPFLCGTTGKLFDIRTPWCTATGIIKLEQWFERTG
jgi:hypothetical protein